MKAISLFSGAGGMDVGFKRAGFEIIGANEIDPYACATFRANHPETVILEDDINRLGIALDAFKPVDVIFGGPPCQGFSVAGKMNPDDPRSQLIFSFCASIERLQPQGFVMENVKSLGTLAKFEYVRQALLSRFQRAGYSVSLHILNAKDFGIPQLRERVFFIGVKQSLEPVLATHWYPYRQAAPTLREVLLPLGKPGSPRNNQVCKAKITLAAKPVLRRSPYAGMLFNGQGRPLNPDGWASTLPASMGGNRTPIIDNNHLYHGAPAWVEEYHQHLQAGGSPHGMQAVPSYLRRLTINEAALLQSFPSDYIFCGSSSKIYEQIGNAVPCQLAYVVAMGLKKALTGTSSAHYVEQGQNFELMLG